MYVGLKFIVTRKNSKQLGHGLEASFSGEREELAMYLVWAGHEEFAPVESRSRESFFLLNSVTHRMVIC